MLKLKSDPKAVEKLPREPLFEVDGVEVTVPVGDFPADFALRYLDYTDKHGLDAATVWLMENGLSQNGFLLLKHCAGVPAEAIAQIHSVLLAKVTGALSSPKGKLKSA